MIGAGSFSTAATIANAGDPVFLGAQRSAAGLNSFFLNGRIGEVITYSRALTLAEIQKIEGYLSKKWGIALT
jgi:hypothetical protein